MSQFRYLRTTVTNQNLIQEEIKKRFNSANACFHSVQNLLSSRLLSKNLKIRIFSSSNVIRVIKSRRMRWAGHVARMGKSNAYTLLVGKPEGKRPLGRPRRKWMNNVRIDLREVGWRDVDWTGLAKDRKR
jgi:hypothetical protein